MDHVSKECEGQESGALVERRRARSAKALRAWCQRRGFTAVGPLEFWHRSIRSFGWFRTAVRLPDGTTRRAYDGPQGWRFGNRSKKKEA